MTDLWARLRELPEPPPKEWPFGLITGLKYLLAEVVLVAITAWGVGRELWPVWLGASIVAGLVYWHASHRYRHWAIHRKDPYYWRQSVLAAGGIVLNIIAALLVEHASDINSPRLASIAIALLLAGFMPVMHVVRTDVNDSAPPMEQQGVWPYVRSWLLNAAVIAAAVAPAMAIVGSPWKAMVAVPLAWFAAALVDRVGRHGWYRVVVGLCILGIVVAVLVVMLVGVEGRSASTLQAIVLAGIAGLLGLVDAVSAWARNRPASKLDWNTRRRRTGVALALCAAAVAAAIVWLVPLLGGVRWQVQALVIAMAVAFGASFIARGQGFALVILLGALVVWTVTDRNEQVPLDPSSDGTGTIIALGDSYIAGEGALRYFPDTNVSGGNDCRRSPSAFPYLVALHFDKSLVFASCSGALAGQIWKTGQIKHGPPAGPIGALAELDNTFPADPDLVLISIGGNDALFGEVGKGCAFPGSCTELKETFDGNLLNVRAAAAEALQKVAERFDSTPIVVVPYPQMLFDVGCNTAPLDSDELPYLHGFVAQLNLAIRNAANDANATLSTPTITWFAPGERAYAGQELCNPQQTDSPINVITLAPTEAASLAKRIMPTNWMHNSFHPSAFGHHLMADALMTWLPGRFPGFDGEAAQDDQVTTEVVSPTADPQPTCAERSACQARVKSWMAGQAVESLRRIFLPVLLLFAAGWFGAVSVRFLLKAS